MNNEELQHFFGPQRHQHVWCSNDVEWGRAMMLHYQHYNGGMMDTTRTAPPSNNIPHILHFIWLGPRPLDETCIDTWREHHSDDWQVYIWRNDNDNNLPSFQYYNQQAFQYALDHELYGMASDILRCEILYQYGGVYVDVDYLCVAPLTSLGNGYDFYCGASHSGGIEVNNGLIACIPQSPIVQRAMTSIHTWFEETKRPLLLVSSFMGGGGAAAAACMLSHDDVMRHTGPGLWTRLLGDLFLSGETDTCMVFPYTVFHPMPNTDRHVEFRDKEEIEARYALADTRAIHLWQCTWQ